MFAASSVCPYPMLLSGKSMQDIIDTSANYMGNPVIVYDSSYVILCCSSNYGYEDPVWTREWTKPCAWDGRMSGNKIRCLGGSVHEV